MQKIIFSLVFSLFTIISTYATQEKQDSASVFETIPTISYSNTPSGYEIAGISVSGVPNLDDKLIINFSGLEIGQKIQVPGEDITNAIKRFWKQGLFSDVKISAEKIVDSQIWLNIQLSQRPRISDVSYKGLKKTQKEEIESKVFLIKGNQITPNLVNRTKDIIIKYFEEKGYLNTEVQVLQEDDIANPGNVLVEVIVDKKERVKIKELQLQGNDAMNFNKINWVMKKTNPKKKWQTFFRTKKYIKAEYEKDKISLIDKYNELGYRDAMILKDSIIHLSEKEIKIELQINEGKKYYFRNIKWVGNTIYPTTILEQLLRIKKGDVYNQKLLSDRLTNDDDAVANIYLDNGYLFFHVEPVESQIEGDSIDISMLMYEGAQATINNITINGNTRVYEHVVRRELRTKPGDLFSKTDLQRTLREIAQMGHFEPTTLTPDIQPNAENGTVDINYNLETKGSDQVELSAGWGSTGIIGSLGLKFTNFSIQNIFNPETYKIVPQGDGQTLSLRAQTNGSYYQNYSIAFMEPWLGGKKPTSLSVTLSRSIQTGVSDRYYSSSDYYNQYYYSSVYGDSYQYQIEYDDEKYIKTTRAAVGVGTRLTWPDDYFTIYGELSYQHYNLQNWQYFSSLMTDGSSNNLSFLLSFSRNSINNPYYTSSGSSFGFSVQATPPYSSFEDASGYSSMTNQELYKWIEYHKWKIKAKTFTPLTKDDKLVLMSRIEYGFLGYYNKKKRSPFETFYMGGDGMTVSSYSSYAIETIGMRGYENGSLTPYLSSGSQVGNLYTKLGFELRYPLMTGQTTIYALAFADAGNCWYDFKEFSPFQLKRSVGVGLRIFLPMIGLMGLDWGYGFDKINGSYDYSKGQFHFIIGQEF